jgi:hypothetical protein
MPIITIARQFGPSAGRWTTPEHVAEAVNSLLDHRDCKQALELSSYVYAEDISRPRTAKYWPALMRLVLVRALTAPSLRAA